ncbi:MAG: SUF system NifU family Fe-S cluster assembly protein [Gammaproteobacteria bacterium]|nr:SUF system NifU family Fe-S cluster assembly protein [Gammaproteobacteria bacterium]
MNNELSDLYQEVILDHNRYPRNHYAMKEANAEAEGYNPLCGDLVKVYLQLCNDTIEKASFVGCGCAISQASASMMTELLTGKTIVEAEGLFKQFQQLVTTDADDDVGALDKLKVLAGVKAYPVRVKCATLAWHTLEAALHHASQPVTTE